MALASDGGKGNAVFGRIVTDGGGIAAGRCGCLEDACTPSAIGPGRPLRSGRTCISLGALRPGRTDSAILTVFAIGTVPAVDAVTAISAIEAVHTVGTIPTGGGIAGIFILFGFGVIDHPCAGLAVDDGGTGDGGFDAPYLLQHLIEPGRLGHGGDLLGELQGLLDLDIADLQNDQHISHIIADLGAAGSACLGRIHIGNIPQQQVSLSLGSDGIGVAVAGALIEQLGTALAVGFDPRSQIKLYPMGQMLPLAADVDAVAGESLDDFQRLSLLSLIAAASAGGLVPHPSCFASHLPPGEGFLHTAKFISCIVGE